MFRERVNYKDPESLKKRLARLKVTEQKMLAQLLDFVRRGGVADSKRIAQLTGRTERVQAERRQIENTLNLKPKRRWVNDAEGPGWSLETND